MNGSCDGPGEDRPMASRRTSLWLAALGQRGIWRRSMKIGLIVGAIQIALNQGDHWVHGRITPVVILKTILTPVVAIAVALVSQACVYVSQHKQPKEMIVMRKRIKLDAILLPLIGIGCSVGIWALVSSLSQDLPSPIKTWKESKLYVTEPFAYRGVMDQGIGRFTWLSLVLVAKGYALALLVGTPLGFVLGLSTMFRKAFDPIFQVLRPVSPLAWLPLGLVLFRPAGSMATEFAALFTIALCAMWPTVLNTAVGVRSIPQDYFNVARVLGLSGPKMLLKVLLPATMPYMFTGFRLSLGIAWLVIVAAEMLTGRAGIGGFLWQEYNSLIVEHIILCILVIGIVGYILDRLMSLVEAHTHHLFDLPVLLARLRAPFRAACVWLTAGRSSERSPADGVS